MCGGHRIWDLSLERDAEEEAQYQAQLKQQQAEVPEDLPPQLLFVHQVTLTISGDETQNAKLFSFLMDLVMQVVK